MLESLKLDPGRPTVLYAPTYQREASLEQNGLAIIESLASLNINMLMRLHHLSVAPRKNGTFVPRDWRTVLRKLEHKYLNLRVVEGDSNPYFVAADLLVGDVSGACYEYILQDKPVVFYDVPSFFEAHGKSGVSYWGRDAGTIVTNPCKLKTAVMDELQNPACRAAARRKLISQLVYECGNAAKRAIAALVDLIEHRIEYPIWGPRQNVRQDALLHAYILERLERCAVETKEVALFGAGAHTPRLLQIMDTAKSNGHRMPKVAFILDDCADAITQPLRGIPVVQPNNDMAPKIDAIILSTDYHQQKLLRRCRDIFGPTMPIIDLYSLFPWHRPGANANTWNPAPINP